jgi:hypothetical protein
LDPANFTAYAMIERERLEQIHKGYDSEHDSQHTYGELARAAAAYALPRGATGRDKPFDREDLWPWTDGWKPADRITGLVRAAALLVAEIQRLQL